MSKVKIVRPSSASSLPYFTVEDVEHGSDMEAWGYRDCVFFSLDEHIVELSQKQMTRLVKFLQKQGKKDL